ncbi:MAG: hypothetical protein EOQ86_28885 [Mesorhizobium sp.]|nr:MAG: hypothetical protein EOQ85_30070 [Mesorhizobium sp.]RWH77026.1 MAG: hypothetical protein EOQ86_28885 [Mesorhizobium sp.]RWM63987.1 MAG: hypothetical protein EOR80_24840 [Mesorhizobium sp.]TIO42184.1 MAG: hypothetical protein E5X81_22950 [Mesorhizobium sp.]TIP92789.1 MAG: hypothetical protein E5X58_13950 [Mesorhizobium sp.]
MNDYTIHEDQNLSDRPYMRTCVPKTMDVEITAFEIIRFIEWPSNYGQAKPDAYADSSYIKFSGELHDKIIVFNMSDGEVATFRTLTDARIRPLPVGAIGGKNKATVFDGIGHSGMSSHAVPDLGLMDGEPGALSYLSDFEEPHGGKTPASLTASLFLDDDKFSRLLAALSINPRPLRTFKLCILAEMFESEMSASLSEPWMSRDYGLLMKGTTIASTRARIESLALSTGVTALSSDFDGEDGDASVIDRVLGIEDGRRTEAGSDPDRTLLKYQRYILIALLVLIAVTAFSA